MPKRQATKPPNRRNTSSAQRPTSRLQCLIDFDEALLAQRDWGTVLIGIDEVGRGSCMGSVVAAAVALPSSFSANQLAQLAALNDSKQLTAPVRSALCQAIQTHCQWAVGEASHQEVETLNVYQASLLAATRAYQCLLLGLEPGIEPLVVLDGKATLPTLPANQQIAVVKGDGQSFSVAAASVVAKHLRDTSVMALARQYPGYGWESNMGYPTPAHKEAIIRLGPTPLHRKTYKPVQAAQLSVFGA